MKVLDLFCEEQHVFEGWFGSEEDYLGQLKGGMVQCPMCGSATIQKRLSAPRLNLGSGRDTSPKMGDQPGDTVGDSAREMASVGLKLIKRILANTDDVGDKFAEEARKIHYGEVDERGIRGKATLDETQSLIEEGIAVMPLFVPDALKRPLQ